MLKLEITEFTTSCSLRQINEFKTNRVWQDIVKELEVWANRIIVEMADPDEQLSERMHSSLRGSLKAITHCIDLPDIFIEYLEQLEEDEEKGGK